MFVLVIICYNFKITDMKNETVLNILLPEVVFMYKEEWKKIPGYVNAFVTKSGKVGLLNSKGVIIKPKIQEWKTTKGTYLYVKVINDMFIPVTKAVHQLVCLAFLGVPPKDGNKYEPNHKNGNKHDNSLDNLEWVTRSTNVQHAFNSGLCTVGLRIEALNILTKEIIKYNSLSFMARKWGLSREIMRAVIASHREAPYMNEWVFSVDDSVDKKISRYQSRSIVYKNYVTGDIIVCKDSAMASYQTGVNSGTIVSRTSPYSKNKDKNKLLSKYVFQILTDNVVWPEYTIAEALESEKKYLKKTVNNSYTT